MRKTYSSTILEYVCGRKRESIEEEGYKGEECIEEERKEYEEKEHRREGGVYGERGKHR